MKVKTDVADEKMCLKRFLLKNIMAWLGQFVLGEWLQKNVDYMFSFVVLVILVSGNLFPLLQFAPFVLQV